MVEGVLAFPGGTSSEAAWGHRAPGPQRGVLPLLAGVRGWGHRTAVLVITPSFLLETAFGGCQSIFQSESGEQGRESLLRGCAPDSSECFHYLAPPFPTGSSLSRGLGGLGPGLPPRPSQKENAEGTGAGVPRLRAQAQRLGSGPLGALSPQASLQGRNPGRPGLPSLWPVSSSTQWPGPAPPRPPFLSLLTGHPSCVVPTWASSCGCLQWTPSALDRAPSCLIASCSPLAGSSPACPHIPPCALGFATCSHPVCTEEPSEVPPPHSLS